MFIAAIIGAALIAAGTIYQIYSTQQSMDYNQEAAENEADAAQARAQQEAARRRRLSARAEARIQTAFAGAGVSVDSGSAFDVAIDQAVQGELSAQAALDEGNMIAWQRNTEKKAIGMQGRSQQVTTLLSGAGAIAGVFSRLPPTSPTTPPQPTGPAPGSFRASQEVGL